MAAPKKKYKILVIEDDKFLKKIYQTKLTLEGYLPILASNGSEGLEAIKNEKPDLVLLDLIMPVKTGFEVLEEINKNKNYKSIPIIVASNLGQDDDQKRVMELGARDYIIKSDTTIQGIINKIKELLGQ
jgi:DNA-binding response OmpR family regulator